LLGAPFSKGNLKSVISVQSLVDAGPPKYLNAKHSAQEEQPAYSDYKSRRRGAAFHSDGKHHPSQRDEDRPSHGAIEPEQTTF
jgi:hypothetical protein